MNPHHKKVAEMMYNIGCMDDIETTSGKKALWTPENCALHKLICNNLADIYKEEDKYRIRNFGSRCQEPFNRTQFEKTVRGEE